MSCSALREGVKKENGFICPKHRTPPTHRARLGQSPRKKQVFFTIFGALKHHEMARYDLPTYVLHVLGDTPLTEKNRLVVFDSFPKMIV